MLLLNLELFMLMLLGELVAGNELGHDDNELNSGDALDITTTGADDDSTDSLDIE